MKNLNVVSRRRRYAPAAFALLLGLCLGRVSADDTEVFFPKEIVQDGQVAKPNLLFLMDTSGSMASTDSTNVSRLGRMQEALSTVLDGLGANINVGLGRLTGSEGGAILFPVSDIDALVKDVDPTQQNVALISKSSGGTNEAQQIAQVVTTGGPLLTLGQIATGTGKTTTYVISRVENEAEQYGGTPSGTVDTDAGAGTRVSDDIEVGRTPDGTPNRTVNQVGLRFEGVALPEGATVTGAVIAFTCKLATETTTFANNLTIDGENADNSVAFEATSNNVSGRSTTSAVVNSWKPDTCNSVGKVVQTPDIKNIVTEIRARSGYVNGNPMTFRITTSGTVPRTFRAFQGGNSTVAPRLILTYTANSQNTLRTFGLRFPSVMIPRGVTLTSATIRFRGVPGMDSAATQTPTNLSATIKLVNSSDAPVFGTTNNAVTSADTAGSVPVAWNIPAMGAGVSTISTPNLAALINTRTAATNANWCGGQALAFTFTTSDTTGLRAFLSGQNADTYPVLSYTYAQNDPALATGCSLKAAVRQISSAANNAEENVTTGAVVLNVNPLDLGYNTSVTPNYKNLVGLRFDNLDLPAGSTILSAVIEFTAQAADSGTAPPLVIRGQNTGDAPIFTSAATAVSARRNGAPTTANVAWTPTTWAKDTTYQTPDIKTVVQEIVNRADWDTRQSMVLMLDTAGATAARRRAYSYATPSKAPKLIIRAQSPNGNLTVRQYLKKLVAEFNAAGNTPVPELLYESAQYWRGGNAYFGKTRGDGEITPDADGFTPDSLNRISGAAAFQAPMAVASNIATYRDPACEPGDPNGDACADEKIVGTFPYKTPLTNQECSVNATVLLSDGEPNNTEYTSVQMIESLIGRTCAGRSTSGDNAGTCGNELAAFMANSDQSTALIGSQVVKTYTIGLADLTSRAFLEGVATAGGGSFYSANSSADITDAFNAILQNVLDIPTTFVAPAVTIDSFNRLTDRNEVYFALFRPLSQTRWEGNFKRYKLGPNANTGTAEIQDADNLSAVDPSTGFFRTTAKSFWNNVVDGDQISKGGVVGRFTTSRKFYTYTGTATALDAGAAAAPAQVNLATGTSNLLLGTNTALTTTMLGDAAMTATEKTSIVDFSRGIDVGDEDGDGSTTDARSSLGDPLHSEPALITYGSTAATPDVTAYFGTNEGALHAIDTATGNERFAFVPQELLPNLTTYARSSVSYLQRPYGVDGPITPLIKDASDNHYSSYKNGTQVLLYFGLRMGGRQYYALDVTDRDAPKLKFVVRGGGTGKYRELGQSWSKPVVARIGFGGAARSVIIFTGGYDPKQEGEVIPTADGMGRAVFIMDADTGERIWWGGIDPDALADNPDLAVPEMRFSVPASPKVVDIDGDGLADRIYIADIGGQIFRFNLNKSAANAATLATYTRVATLGGNSNVDARRFYQAPDVSIIKLSESSPAYLSIAIGSGYRGHPLSEETRDYFYVLKDPDADVGANTLAVLNAAGARGPIKDTDLYDATANAIASGNAATARNAKVQLDAARGFYVRLQPSPNDASLNGEKVLTDAQTFNGNVMFATYIPGARSTGSACQASSGTSRFYLMSVVDGRPVRNFDGLGTDDPTTKDVDESLTTTDRYDELNQGGLPPNPTILFAATNGTLPDKPIVCVGSECLDPGFTIASEKTYWIRRQ